MSDEIEPVVTPMPGLIFGNVGEPVRVQNVGMDGIAGASSFGGDKVQIITRIYLTSDDRFFHKVVTPLGRQLAHLASVAGHPVNIEAARTILLVIKPDNSGELWVDTAAMALHMMPKRSMKAGTVVFEHDIADVVGLSFPKVDIGSEDRVLCIIRVGWRFALFADFNPKRFLSLSDMQRDLGTLHRKLTYAELYDNISDPQLVEYLTQNGWFPFAEIIGSEFNQLVDHLRSGYDLDKAQNALIENFGPDRLERMFERWMEKEHFAEKELVLRSALRAYAAEDPVGVIKAALTEIEGILNHAHRKQHGRGAKIKGLLKFVIEMGQARTGAPDTLLLTERFSQYLNDYTFANFDPSQGSANSGSRHAVGHGAASGESYTMTRALQVLLTLDQLALYT